MAFGNEAALLFRIKGDESDAVRAIKNTKGEANDLTGVLGTTGSALSGLAGPASIAAGAITAIGAGAIAAGAALFSMAKNAAEYGSEIYDASQKTGLHAETLSALKFAAEQAGGSFDGLVRGVGNFQKSLGEAELGSDKAKASMKALGVTSTDTETALNQAVKTIYNAKDANVQAALAAEAFGAKLGRELLPLIKDAQGDFDTLKDKARALGITISDEAAAQADEFGDQMDLLDNQLAAVGRTIGQAVIPVFLDMSRKMSDWLGRNQGDVKAWADSFGGAMQRAVREMDAVGKWIEDHPTFWGVVKQFAWNAITQNPGGFVTPAFQGRELTAEDTALMRFRKRIDDRRNKPANDLDTTDTGAADKAAKDAERDRERAARAAEKARLDAEREAERAAEAEKRRQEEFLDTRRQGYRDALDFLDDEKAARVAAFQLEVDMGRKTAQDLAEFRIAEDKRVNDELLQTLKDWVAMVQDPRNGISLSNQYKALADVEELTRKLATERLELGSKELKAARDYTEELLKQRDAIAEMRALHPEDVPSNIDLSGVSGRATLPGVVPQSDTPTDDEIDRMEQQRDAVDRLRESYKQLFDEMARAGDVQATMTDLGQMGLDIVNNMTDALENAIENWILYGESVGKALQKALAAELAHIAAKAAVRALEATAWGFLQLAYGNFAAAAQAFKSAAIWAAVAVTAGVAARAIAPANNQGVAGSSGSASGGASPIHNADNQGKQYSGQKDRTDEYGRNGSIPAIPVEIRVRYDRDPQGLIGKMVAIEVANNGQVRRIIRDGASG